MIELINKSGGVAQGTPVSFVVETPLVADSVGSLTRLLEAVGDKRATITLWAARDEDADANELASIVREIGRSRVFVDLPKATREKLKQILS